MDNTLQSLRRAATLGDPDALERLHRAEERAGVFDPFGIVIDGETFTVDEALTFNEFADEVVEVETDNGQCFILASSAEVAGAYARERWADMARDDPQEFTAIVGAETLIRWGLGQYAGPGSTQVRSLQEWLDLWLVTPEEELAGYDGVEREVTRIGSALEERLEFVPTVAYRSN